MKCIVECEKSNGKIAVSPMLCLITNIICFYLIPMCSVIFVYPHGIGMVWPHFVLKENIWQCRMWFIRQMLTYCKCGILYHMGQKIYRTGVFAL